MRDGTAAIFQVDDDMNRRQLPRTLFARSRLSAAVSVSAPCHDALSPSVVNVASNTKVDTSRSAPHRRRRIGRLELLSSKPARFPTRPAITFFYSRHLQASSPCLNARDSMIFQMASIDFHYDFAMRVA